MQYPSSFAGMYLLITLTFACPAAAAKTDVLSPDSIQGTSKIDAEQLIDLVEKTPDIVIIDSRIIADRDQGYIEGSISLPNTDTTCESLSKVVPDLARPSLFYCNGIKCGRSAIAIKIAVGCGYTNLFWFRGGFEEWKNKGYPIVGVK
jgi:rhodanese-related sulfurtransferase